MSREGGWGNRLSGSLATEGLTCFVFLEMVLPYTKITQSVFELEKGMWGSMFLYSLELFMLLRWGLLPFTVRRGNSPEVLHLLGVAPSPP